MTSWFAGLATMWPTPNPETIATMGKQVTIISLATKETITSPGKTEMTLSSPGSATIACAVNSAETRVTLRMAQILFGELIPTAAKSSSASRNLRLTSFRKSAYTALEVDAIDNVPGAS